MLKIIYAETGQHLEQIAADTPTARLRQEDNWIAKRLKFAKSIGQTLFVSKERAALMLRKPLCDVMEIDTHLRSLGADRVTVECCDLDWIEIGLAGSWIYTDFDSGEGVFVAQQPDRVESYLWQLWQVAKIELVAYERSITCTEE
jgi:hypothetical protein